MSADDERYVDEFREEMVRELEDIYSVLEGWKERREGDMYASERDRLYDALLALSELQDSLNETLYVEDNWGVEER